jgi:hypothetical protein
MSILDANMVGGSSVSPSEQTCLILCQGSLPNVDLHAHHNGPIDTGWQHLVRNAIPGICIDS